MTDYDCKSLVFYMNTYIVLYMYTHVLLEISMEGHGTELWQDIHFQTNC